MVLYTTALADNRIPGMEIDVVLRPDGSAHITQIWNAETGEGTEFYLGCRDNGYLTITNFSVADDYGTYTLVEDWDVDASLEEKARKCGIVETDNGVELCWGISEYGKNRYTIEYVLHGLVGNYSDLDGFNHRFVDEMATFPTDVVLTIRMEDGSELTDELSDIWAFGFDGQIRFEDGVIRAWSESPLEDDQHMTVMVSFQKGVLSPLRTEDDSFETVKERAFDGSDYEDDLTPFEIFMIIAVIVFLIVLVIVVAVIAEMIHQAKLKKRMNNTAYFRDAPNGGNLNATYLLARCCGLCSEDTLLGAYFLRLISDGCLEPVFTHSAPKDTNLALVHAPRGADPYDDVLYTVLEAAANQDRVLQPKELEQYCQKNCKPLMAFVESCEQNGEKMLSEAGCFKGTARSGLGSLTTEGDRKLDEILGLKRFLLDFSLVQERDVREAVVWRDYMIYAHLLGIADKVAPQLRKLYPNEIHQIDQFERDILYTGHYNTILYGAYHREQQRLEAERSGGSGGRASFGGGGGFSGGGGGGTR